ncbi:hypothetical protein F5879DRAFT_156331 [Lentinula edodes]|nr:hypothetical protein F5879DRAFT_156331 [Lentinula edodes]
MYAAGSSTWLKEQNARDMRLGSRSSAHVMLTVLAYTQLQTCQLLRIFTNAVPVVIPRKLQRMSLKAASEDYPKGKALSEELQLDRKRLKDDSYMRPRKLFYGFGVNIQDFIDYHQRYNLPRPPPEDDRSLLWLYMMDQVLEDLKKTCHFYRFKRELAISV